MADTDDSNTGGRNPLRHPPRLDHRGDEAQLSRLRHERDRVARAARCARRPEAGAPAHPLLDARERLHAGQAVREIGARRRRRDGQIPSARRPGDLRRAGAHGAGLLHAPAADRRAGQFRLGRRRSAGGRCATPKCASPSRRWRCSTTSTRTPSISRTTTTATSASRSVLPARFPESAGQRRRRHRRRHGDQHPAAQSRRGDRRLRRADRRSGARPSTS